MAKKSDDSKPEPDTEKLVVDVKEPNLVCGIVMPISPIDGYPPSHWSDVLNIIQDSVATKGFTANLVSSAEAAGVIQKNIVQNLYDNPIVVCDVSARNPNVMFELGMRLAFDKPTVVIKDEKTPFSFDIGAIEHVQYPSDLRYSRIVAFKQELAEKVDATLKESKKQGYTTFLKHFSSITVAKIDSRTGTKEDVILEQLADIRGLLAKRKVVPVLTAPLEMEYVGDDPDLLRWYLREDIRSRSKEYLEAGIAISRNVHDTLANELAQKYKSHIEKGVLSAEWIRREVIALLRG